MIGSLIESDPKNDFKSFENKDVVIAGRIMAIRKMGKASFFHIEDSCGRMQVYIKKDDVVVLSVPFSDTGASPEYWDDLLRQCTRHNVPVMLDLAYVNLATDFYLDLNHACIEYVVTSLSKVFPLELHRVGLRLQRKKFEAQLYVINEPNYDYINI